MDWLARASAAKRRTGSGSPPPAYAATMAICPSFSEGSAEGARSTVKFAWCTAMSAGGGPKKAIEEAQTSGGKRPQRSPNSRPARPEYSALFTTRWSSAWVRTISPCTCCQKARDAGVFRTATKPMFTPMSSNSRCSTKSRPSALARTTASTGARNWTSTSVNRKHSPSSHASKASLIFCALYKYVGTPPPARFFITPRSSRKSSRSSNSSLTEATMWSRSGRKFAS
mmetsp:Transcript_26102/g.78673  ORF Transcript_26102/g.78673 Transcript_26102/m.78673 type:complete len:227 (-) Transcript_26102:39-719(-)